MNLASKMLHTILNNLNTYFKSRSIFYILLAIKFKLMTNISSNSLTFAWPQFASHFFPIHANKPLTNKPNLATTPVKFSLHPNIHHLTRALGESQRTRITHFLRVNKELEKSKCSHSLPTTNLC